MNPDVWIVLAVAAVILAAGLAAYLFGFAAGREHERWLQADRDRMKSSAQRATR